MSETLNVDTVIDRLYVKSRNRYETKTLIKKLEGLISCTFTFRNYTKEYIQERLQKLEQFQKQLNVLTKLPILEQRSQEWYDIRQNLITASDFAQALGDGKFGTQKQFFQKKCGYEKDTFDNNMPALKWGIKYEPIAIDAYAAKNKVKMYEFGLLIHPQPNMKWFGASPDAISELGIMVEIKCPWRRVITGEVPKQYYYQIQGQLDVCCLQECDFLECEFIEYSNAEEFQRHFDDNENEKGVIIEYFGKDNQTQYVYSPFEYNRDYQRISQWEQETRSKLNQSITITKTYYWQLHTFSVVRVYKDDNFLKEKFTQLKLVWDKINEYKMNKTLYDQEIVCTKSKSMMIDTNIDPIVTTKQPKNGFKDVKLNGWAFVSDDDEED